MAMRGRNKDEGSYAQRIELGNQYYTNTITSVCKDNLLMEFQSL